MIKTDPAPKTGDIVDHTTKRRPRYTRNMYTCPKCGRIAERRPAGPGRTLYIHKKKFLGLFDGWEALDQCYVNDK